MPVRKKKSEVWQMPIFWVALAVLAVLLAAAVGLQGSIRAIVVPPGLELGACYVKGNGCVEVFSRDECVNLGELVETPSFFGGSPLVTREPSEFVSNESCPDVDECNPDSVRFVEGDVNMDLPCTEEVARNICKSMIQGGANGECSDEECGGASFEVSVDDIIVSRIASSCMGDCWGWYTCATASPTPTAT